MASVSFAQNTYAGEVLEDLLTYTAQGNDTYKEGLIHIKSGIQYKYTLPSVSLGDIIQDNKPTPTSPTDSKGTYTFRERYLEPKDFMVYLEFNPRDFENTGSSLNRMVIWYSVSLIRKYRRRCCDY